MQAGTHGIQRKKQKKRGIKISEVYSQDVNDNLASDIYDLADQIHPDFIIIGAKGRTAAAALFLGSLAEKMVNDIFNEIEAQLVVLPRKDIAKEALKNSKFVVITDTNKAFDLINHYAPEHLIIASDHSEEYVEMIINTGSVFLGNYCPESAGDYASGTNHTLPTNGWAKNYSGVNMDAFYKKVTFQSISKQGIENLGQTIIDMAEGESLQAHANAVKIRLNPKS